MPRAARRPGVAGLLHHYRAGGARQSHGHAASGGGRGKPVYQPRAICERGAVAAQDRRAGRDLSLQRDVEADRQGDGVRHRFQGLPPGGINRRATVAPYAADTLINYEVGWKTTLLDGLIRFNGAVYQQDWKGFSSPSSGRTASPRSRTGRCADPGRGIGRHAVARCLALTAAGSYTDAKTRRNLCAINEPTFTCTGTGNFISAPAGTRCGDAALQDQRKRALHKAGRDREGLCPGARDAPEFGLVRHPHRDPPDGDGRHRQSGRAAGTACRLHHRQFRDRRGFLGLYA